MANMSGIGISDEMSTMYNALYNGHKYKWCTFKIATTEVVPVESLTIEEMKNKEELKNLDPYEMDKKCFDDLVASLNDEQPLFVLFDIHTKTKEGSKKEKPVWIHWCSDNCKITQKMIFGATRGFIQSKLRAHANFQISDISDIEYDEICKEVRK